jgi:hypothetical protein
MSEFISVSLRFAAGDHEAWGWPTRCAQLAVTPDLDQDGAPTGEWRLTHIPTGYHMPNWAAFTPAELIRVASLVAHLDWSIDRDGLTDEHKHAFSAAVWAVEEDRGLPPEGLPSHSPWWSPSLGWLFGSSEFFGEVEYWKPAVVHVGEPVAELPADAIRMIPTPPSKPEDFE